MAEQQPDETLEVILDAGVWEFGDFEFAGGQRANNKFFMEWLLREPYEYDVIRGMGIVASNYSPDILIGVPSGGSVFASRLGEAWGIPVVKMVKDRNEPGIKSYTFVTEEDEEQVREAENLVIVEDITNRLTSICGMLGNVAIRTKARAAVAVMSRTLEADEKKS